MIVNVVVLMLIQIDIILNIYYANKAGINIGLITIAWGSVTVFLLMLFDRCLFGQRITIFAYISILMIVGSIILVAYDHMPSKQVDNKKNKTSSALQTTMILTFFTPILFAVHNLISRSTQDRLAVFDFDPVTWNLTSMSCGNCVILVFAIVEWSKNGIDMQWFWIGLIASFFGAVGVANFMSAFNILSGS